MLSMKILNFRKARNNFCKKLQYGKNKKQHWKTPKYTQNKFSVIKTITSRLTERLLKMKDWAATLGEDRTDGDNLELEMNSESENGAYLDHPPKGALKKLIHAAKFNASFKTLEGEINQIYIQSSEVDKMKEELTECIKNLETEQASLQSENTI
ncbi:Melanoma inhibitory activity protein 2 [Plecturocebus cupreus]